MNTKNTCKIKITVYDNNNTELISSRMIDMTEITGTFVNVLDNEVIHLLNVHNTENRKNNPHHYSNRID